MRSEKIELILKAREAALSAVQVYNNPLTSFKTESFIVLFIIAWTYTLHAFYRGKKIDYRFYTIPNKRKKFIKNTDGTIKYWDLSKCLSDSNCPIDNDAKNNLKFLIGLRNQIEHKKAHGLDSYLSGRYQACALNFNFYLKKFFGEKYSLDTCLALSLQFAALDYTQAQVVKNKEKLISKNIQNYIAKFDNDLSDNEIKNERFSYRLLFVKVGAKRRGQADRVIEFIDPKSPMAKNVTKEYWVKEDREKPKYRASDVVKEIKQLGYKDFGMYQHTQLWRKFDAKNPSKDYGVEVGTYWYWYKKWIEFIITKISK